VENYFHLVAINQESKLLRVENHLEKCHKDIYTLETYISTSVEVLITSLLNTLSTQASEAGA